MKQEAKSKVYFDGECAMCSNIMLRLNKSAQNSNLTTIDISKDKLPENISSYEAHKEIHMVDSDGKKYANIDAILKILSQDNRYKLLVMFGKFPLIHFILKIGYRLVAANRYWIDTKIFWLKIVLSLATISGLMLSFKLWISTRFYPLTPMIPGFPQPPFPFDYAIFSIMVGLLAGIIFSNKPKIVIFLFLILAGLECFLDQSRLQPWVYQYFFMFLILGLFSWNKEDIKGQRRALLACGLIIASIYFFSGIQKINSNYVDNISSWMISPVLNSLPRFFNPSAFLLGFISILLEIYIGIGLLRRNSRNIAVYLVIFLVALIMSSLISKNWNTVVWPWNIAMAVFVIIIFGKDKTSTLKDYLLNPGFRFQPIIVILFLFMPILSLFNLWDSYLSATLYSGNTNSAVVYVNKKIKSKFPNEVQKYAYANYFGETYLSIGNWSQNELNVPAYPEERIFKNVGKYLCRFDNNSNDVNLVINGKPTWFNGGVRTEYNCSNL